MQKMLIIHLHFEVGQSVMHFLLPLTRAIWCTFAFIHLANRKKLCQSYLMQSNAHMWTLFDSVEKTVTIAMEITSALRRRVSAQLAATEWSASHREKNAPKRIIWINHLMHSISSMIFLWFDYSVFFRTPEFHQCTLSLTEPVLPKISFLIKS